MVHLFTLLAHKTIREQAENYHSMKMTGQHPGAKNWRNVSHLPLIQEWLVREIPCYAQIRIKLWLTAADGCSPVQESWWANDIPIGTPVLIYTTFSWNTLTIFGSVGGREWQRKMGPRFQGGGGEKREEIFAEKHRSSSVAVCYLWNYWQLLFLSKRKVAFYWHNR